MIYRFENFEYEYEDEHDYTDDLEVEHRGYDIVQNHAEGDIIMRSLNNTLGNLVPVERIRGAHRDKIYKYWIKESDLKYTEIEEQPEYEEPHYLDYKRKQTFQAPKFKRNVSNYSLLLTLEREKELIDEDTGERVYIQAVVDKKIWNVLENVFELTFDESNNVLSWFLNITHNIETEKIGRSY